ncbi:hypothetical protein AYL99_01656 [Fonsecaea erecta]|uniref:Uncharacterized protein n=1 Tax=Fonsecaea erecta TaxID=1367422 RepID=A0A179A0M2_9EURO|nr:hypothetical protein AYL99_01656 [Fonsecaea erecta]OAP65684.1 hypothetical protein AYL99_01656 [Fonsecaea erecta]
MLEWSTTTISQHSSRNLNQDMETVAEVLGWGIEKRDNKDDKDGTLSLIYGPSNNYESVHVRAG